MNEALKALLFTMRQHPGFPELLRAVEKPRLPKFKPNGGESAEQFGAKSIHVSGQQAQHERWLALLTGEPSPQGDD